MLRHFPLEKKLPRALSGPRNADELRLSVQPGVLVFPRPLARTKAGSTIRELFAQV
jgi:hypothetical protein